MLFVCFFLMDGKEDSPLTETALVAILERALEEKFGQIRETMSELRQSMNFLSDRFDNVLQRLNHLETNRDSVKNENRHLKAEVLRLSGILERHSTELNEIEQYSRRECVEISGLPVEVEENTVPTPCWATTTTTRPGRPGPSIVTQCL